MSLSRRIVGLETEYGLAVDGGPTSGLQRLGPEDAARELFRKLVEWGRSTNVFLPNGGRLYLDVGSHPEYATAECDDLLDLVAQDRAGEALLTELAEDASARMAAAGRSERLHLIKTNVDSHGNSFGCHENYLTRRRGDFPRLLAQLVPFFVTRQILTGAGDVQTGPTGSRYVFSQRSMHMREAVSSATTRSRPIINSRDEPHADPQRYRRLHVISGDSSIAEPTTLLKVGATAFVLDLLESGASLADLELADPARAIHDTSVDLSGRAELELTDGRSITPLAMQQEYLRRAREHVSDRELTGTETRVLELWERGLRAVESGDHTLVETELDWAIKARLIERYRRKHDLHLHSPRLARLVLAYHDISPTRGLAATMTRRGLMARVVSDEQVATAQRVPPQTTRARLRGAFVAAAHAHRRDHTADWVHLKLNDASYPTVLLQDPFAVTDERVERLIAAMEDE